ncbi:cupin domain [Motilibacter rhizosphaerae]|uniref:Cupin domain n=2 Tax=Motilibacter rhizosphaerae TaxID=598652 RepID=A0A4Q7NTX4_9ACTN|nr:cupin domain [Motilibacter rhizosphaerae]
MTPMDPVTRELLLTAPVEPLTVDRIEVRRITMAPGTAPGAHTHNGPVVGTVLEGSVLVQVGDEEPRILRAGDPFYEPADVPVPHFDALEDGVVFLACFPLPPGQDAELTMLP